MKSNFDLAVEYFVASVLETQQHYQKLAISDIAGGEDPENYGDLPKDVWAGAHEAAEESIHDDFNHAVNLEIERRQTSKNEDVRNGLVPNDWSRGIDLMANYILQCAKANGNPLRETINNFLDGGVDVEFFEHVILGGRFQQELKARLPYEKEDNIYPELDALVEEFWDQNEVQSDCLDGVTYEDFERHFDWNTEIEAFQQWLGER